MCYGYGYLMDCCARCKDIDWICRINLSINYVLFISGVYLAAYSDARIFSTKSPINTAASLPPRGQPHPLCVGAGRLDHRGPAVADGGARRTAAALSEQALLRALPQTVPAVGGGDPVRSLPILFDCCISYKLPNRYQFIDYSVARFKDQIRYLFMSCFMNTKASQYAAYFMYLRPP